MGAAVQAGVLAGEVKERNLSFWLGIRFRRVQHAGPEDLVLLDVVPLSLSVVWSLLSRQESA